MDVFSVLRFRGAELLHFMAELVSFFFMNRKVETTGVTFSAQPDKHHVNGALESEANPTRIAEVHSERPLAITEKVSITPAESPAALPAVNARTEDNTHQDRAAHSDDLDMDLFQWPKFLVSLSRKEKEDDFFAIKGTKLPVRPKKRTKLLERTVTVSGLFSILSRASRKVYSRFSLCISI